MYRLHPGDVPRLAPDLAGEALDSPQRVVVEPALAAAVAEEDAQVLPVLVHGGRSAPEPSPALRQPSPGPGENALSLPITALIESKRKLGFGPQAGALSIRRRS